MACRATLRAPHQSALSTPPSSSASTSGTPSLLNVVRGLAPFREKDGQRRILVLNGFHHTGGGGGSFMDSRTHHVISTSTCSGQSTNATNSATSSHVHTALEEDLEKDTFSLVSNQSIESNFGDENSAGVSIRHVGDTWAPELSTSSSNGNVAAEISSTLRPRNNSVWRRGGSTIGANTTTVRKILQPRLTRRDEVSGKISPQRTVLPRSSKHRWEKRRPGEQGTPPDGGQVVEVREGWLVDIEASLASAPVEGGDYGKAVTKALASWERKLTPTLVCHLLNSQQEWERALGLFEWMKRKGPMWVSTKAYNIVIKILGRAGQCQAVEAMFKEMGEWDCVPDRYTYTSMIHAFSRSGWVTAATQCFDKMVAAGIDPNDVTYSLLMTMYLKKGLVAEAERVLQGMHSRGVAYANTYTAMLRMYSQAGMFDKAAMLFDEMLAKDLPRDVVTYNAALNMYGKADRADDAVRVFRQMQDEGCRPNIVTYNTMISVLGKGNRFEEAMQIFSSMQDNNCVPDEVTYCTMIGACSRAGQLEEATRLLSQMQEAGFVANQQVYRTLINLYGKAEDWEEVLRTHVEMELNGAKPDQFTLNLLMKLYGRAGMVEEAHRTFRSLQSLGVTPQATDYTSLIYLSLKVRNTRQAVSLIKELCQSGPALGPAALYLMHSCRELGLVAEAEEALQYIKSNPSIVYENDGPNTALELGYHMMIEIYCSEGKLEEAFRTFDEMCDAGIRPNLICCNIAINAVSRAGLHDRASQLFLDLQEKWGLVPDTYTFSAMIKTFGRAGHYEKAVSVYWKMQEAGVQPDNVTYNTLINVCGCSLPVEETARLFQEMLDAGFVPNRNTYNVMVKAYGKAGRFDEAEELILNMRRMEHSPGPFPGEEGRIIDIVTYNTLIDCYGKRRLFDKMEATLKDLMASGLVPTQFTYNSFIDAYGKNGEMKRMEETLCNMQICGVKPDMSTFNTVINVYGKSGRFDQIDRVMDLMKKEGLKPDRWTYNTLIAIYGEAERPEDAVRAFRDMQEQEILPDRVTYMSIIAAFEKSGQLLEAARWQLWMKQAGFTRYSPPTTADDLAFDFPAKSTPALTTAAEEEPAVATAGSIKSREEARRGGLPTWRRSARVGPSSSDSD